MRTRTLQRPSQLRVDNGWEWKLLENRDEDVFGGFCFNLQHPITQVALRTDIPTSLSKSENLSRTTWTAGRVFPEVKRHMTLFFDYSEKSKGKWQTSWLLTNKLWKWLLWNWPALSKFAKNVGELCSADLRCRPEVHSCTKERHGESQQGRMGSGGWGWQRSGLTERNLDSKGENEFPLLRDHKWKVPS